MSSTFLRFWDTGFEVDIVEGFQKSLSCFFYEGFRLEAFMRLRRLRVGSGCRAESAGELLLAGFLAFCFEACPIMAAILEPLMQCW